ncbi:MAG: hypothetical protein RI842_09880, partial [Schleiferiaceae bacterium]|nr:hypothetical protein [Schleiferiaceae bacterium]
EALYPGADCQYPTTHLYVKLEPQYFEDILAIENADIEYFDFPLTREVIEMGDYYQNPPEDEFPTLYAVVPEDFIFPDISYTVLSNLHLNIENDPLVLAQAFKQTDNAGHIYNDVVPEGGFAPGDYEDFIQTNIPEMPTDCPPTCVPKLEVDNSTSPVTYYWRCDCTTDPDPPTISDCGCEVPDNRRYPGGCIKVEDTELSDAGDPNTFEGIRRVKITAWDGWFTFKSTQSDDQGCWSITGHKFSGKVRLYVTFKNNRARLRGTPPSGWALWRWFTAIQDYVAKVSGPRYNNIAINYHMYQTQGSFFHRYWGAAMTNNALHEFYDYANQDGLQAPKHLDLFVALNRSDGFAIGDAKYHLTNPLFNLMQGRLLYAVALPPVSNLIAPFIPDVSIGVNYDHSDRLKELAYHEYAHASHEKLVGVAYWADLAAAEINANGHGNQNSTDAGLISVVEAWGTHVGFSYTHRKYGPDNSIGGNWEAEVETYWNESTNHIPGGLFHDLKDTGEQGLSFSGENPPQTTTVVDNVSGFTHFELYQTLGDLPYSVGQYQTDLGNRHPNWKGNTAAEVNDLFNSY